MKNKPNIETILNHYLYAALWTEDLDSEKDTDDFAPESVDQAREDITFFLKVVSEALPEDALSEWSDEQIGHDLWLTRNRHGAGFWDRDLGYNTELTDTAQNMGEKYAYISDNGLVAID